MKFKLDKCLFVISMNIPRPKVAKESTRSTNVEIQHLKSDYCPERIWTRVALLVVAL
jgi:hypothetical protein